MLVGSTILLVRDLAFETGFSPLALTLLIVVLGTSAALIFSSKRMSLPRLRALELLIFGAAAAYLAAQGYALLLEQLALGGAGTSLSVWNRTMLHFVLLMVVYGIFVPNAWPRAALGVVSIALTPLAMVALLTFRHSEYADVIGGLATPGQLLGDMVLLLIGAAVAVFAAYIIHECSTAAFEADDSQLYDLEKKIGTGGMGEVWLARHSVLARPAAIKLIREDMVGARDTQEASLLLRRFEREAKATAALRSPHTVEIYDFGVTNDGTFFYAMEYLDGLDLETLIKQHGPLPAARAVFLLLQACESLADAHHSGLTHRDVKPANIYACRMGVCHDYIKLLDFGLAKTVQPTEGVTQLTVDGTTSGTPAYMAPEMAVSKDDVDCRADLYSLGCVGYWLLTGRQVFEGDSAVSVIIDHVQTAPVPPSQRTEIEIPEELSRIILKCLEKDPADRYQSAETLAADLTACPLATPWDVHQAKIWWELHLPRLAA